MEATTNDVTQPSDAHVANGQESVIAALMRRSMLAMLGGLALTGDAIEDNFDRMAARGEQIQNETTEILREVLGQFRFQPHAPSPTENDRGGLDWLIEQMGLPTQQDVDTLQSQIERLTDRVEELIARRCS
ncbi:MAG: phasin family protein [Chloroflexales bacterium]|nr:phasin family protein [Chloroflexales bacterium]